MFYEFRV
jgi:hypothetical protein